MNRSLIRGLVMTPAETSGVAATRVTLAGLRASLAGATVPCRYTAVANGIEIVCIGGKLSLDGQGHLPHVDCMEGRVYLIPDSTGVRVPCQQLGIPICRNKTCIACHGRGWTAAEDGWEEQCKSIKMNHVSTGWAGSIELENGAIAEAWGQLTYKEALGMAMLRAVEATAGVELGACGFTNTGATGQRL